ncbi:DUF3048 domain-containing protein [Planococcus sp. ISL-109]|uniref:DUF3048 domain-containing protein n=1 Tax=Planococcus sp. ISL-109 TaxID=2819166 RepID=UPI001BEBFBD2|nr:DUF3048 domain-containing protein [Planococcus sp. ISL-109]MBT2584120.1 DUF3048 domain-containing protein [Planococcus sp. ISL-109]
MKKWLLVLSLLLIIGLLGYWLMGRDRSELPQTPETPDAPEQVPEEVLTTAPFTGLEGDGPYDRRAVMAVINNHPAARPQTGLGEADMVFELIAEYNITRFLALYQSQFPVNIGPVRSARDYFVELASAYDAFFVAHGYSPEAKRLLDSGVVDHINGMQYDGTLFKRSLDRVAPHNSYITYENIKLAMDMTDASTNYSVKAPYAFSAPGENDKLGEQATSVEVIYGGDTVFTSTYTYDAETKRYTRASGGTVSADKESLQRIEVANVLVIEADHQTIDAKGRQEIDLLSGGRALLFQEGIVRVIEWREENGMLVPIDDSGTAALTEGKTWIHIVPETPGLNQAVQYTP